ncbi:MAG: gliding motility-associated C-terminal domain-containing protein, partial [Bacteroidales bacterium]|nr:gliding motility-associated C-terminal domain-containing protein [Bacteroidales bacterium]
NAFAPKGLNNKFTPITTFSENSNYLFQIYNRRGQKLFETKEPQQGWDGRVNNNFVQFGVYVYLITFSDENGDNQIKKGTFTVVY